MSNFVDVLAFIDDNPRLLRRPLLPYAMNILYIPLFTQYDPQDISWPEKPYYYENFIYINALLINGKKFDYIEGDNPPIGNYSLVVTDTETLVLIAFDPETLWQYQQPEIIGIQKVPMSLLGTKDNDGTPNPPLISNFPDLRSSADPLNIARMDFSKISIDLLYTAQNILAYGGDMVFSMLFSDGNTINAGKFIIEDISYNKDIAQLKGIDYRYLLNKNFPIETFSQKDYMYIQEEFINQVKPVVLGHGNGIPGICTNGNKIYNDLHNLNDKVEWYEYYFYPGWIGKPLKIEYKDNDTWIEIYPGLGNPYFKEEYKPDHLIIPSQQKSTVPLLDPIKGIVKVHAIHALGILSGGENEEVNIDYSQSPNEVRMYAKWPNYNVKDAIKYLLNATGKDNLSDGFNGEFENLAEIGLFLNESKPVFEWIEKIQSGNVLGGMLKLNDNKIFFKQENPNRNKLFDLDVNDVLNHKTLNMQMATELFYSDWVIEYIKSIADDQKGSLTGNTERYPTAGTYNAEDLTILFNYKTPTEQYFDDTQVQKRINIFNDLIRTPRHKITGLKMPLDLKYAELEIYDVIGYLPETLEGMEKSMYDWIIYEKTISVKDNCVLLTLIERVKTTFI